MVQATTARFRQAAVDGGRTSSLITCTPPGGDAVELDWSSATVSCALGSGARYSAALGLTPLAGIDLYGIVTTPGARFSIDHGFDFGAGDVERVAMGRYELARNGANVFGGDISIDLVDQWAKLERNKFDVPYTPPAGTRAAAIAAVVAAAIPGVSIRIESDGGLMAGGLTWERSRTQMISDLAADGGLECAFDAAGVFVIRDEPIIRADAPVWTFKSGENSNIKTADRERPFDRLYNRVVVVPQDESQTWAAQSLEISDTNHPLHWSKYGVSTFFYSSPTITTAAEALAAARTILQRFQGTTETLSIGSFGYFALEAGDTVSVVKEPTETDPGFGAVHLGESFNFDLNSSDVTAATRSTALADLEEAA